MVLRYTSHITHHASLSLPSPNELNEPNRLYELNELITHHYFSILDVGLWTGSILPTTHHLPPTTHRLSPRPLRLDVLVLDDKMPLLLNYSSAFLRVSCRVEWLSRANGWCSGPRISALKEGTDAGYGCCGQREDLNYDSS